MNQIEKKPLRARQLSAEISALNDQLKRVAADFDNYRKRTEEDSKMSFQVAQAHTLLELAPVLDNFRRATEHLPKHLEDDNWVKGVLYIEKQLEAIFEQAGVTRIKTVGEIFDPQLHEAVSTEPSETVPEHHIMAELEGGYMLNGSVLKPAKVKVSSGSSI